MAFGTGSKSSFCPLLTAPACPSSAALPFPCPCECPGSAVVSWSLWAAPGRSEESALIKEMMKSVKSALVLFVCLHPSQLSTPSTPFLGPGSGFPSPAGLTPGVPGSRVPLAGGSAQKPQKWRGGRGRCWAWPEVLRSSGVKGEQSPGSEGEAGLISNRE